MKSVLRSLRMKGKIALLVLFALPCFSAQAQWTTQASFDVSDDTLYICNGSTATVSFTNLTVMPNNSTPFWSFGVNNATSTLANPSFNYTTAGTYTVRLEIKQGNTLLSFLNRTIVVYNPVALFTVNQSSGCENGTVFQFTNQPILADSFVWNFGDGIAINQNNPTHVFSNANPNTNVSLLVYVNGFVNTCAADFENINVLPKPNAIITANPLTSCQQNEAINFTNSSLNAVSHYWNFGYNNNTSTLPNPSFTYPTAGTYNVTYIATGSGGCTDTANVSIYVGNSPPMQVNVASQSGCSPYNVSLTATLIPNVVSYIWDFGDGPPETVFSPTANHTYINNGTSPVSYNVSVTAFVANGSSCNNSVTLNNFITVNPLPQASFSVPANVSCINAPVSFTNTSQGATSFNWSFGNSQTSTDVLPSTLYSISGYFDVELVATNQYGCKDTAVVDSAVYVPNLNANFQANNTSGCSVSAQFANFSTGGTQFFWDFGDNTTSTQASPTHLYTLPGSYTVTLVAINGGCTDTLVMPNYINVTYSSPNYTAPAPFNGCVGIASTFNANNPTGSGFIWNFGDGTTASGDNPSHIYTAPGTYTVSLITTTNTGCQEMIPVFATVNVYGGEPEIHTENVSCEAPYTVNFTTPTVGYTYNWDFGDGGTSTVQNTAHIYTADGYYNVSLTVVTPGGCVATYNGINHLALFPFQAGYESTCVPVGAQLYTQIIPKPADAASAQWTFSDGQSSNQVSPNMVFDTLNTPIYFTAIITTQFGCVDTINGLACAKHDPNIPKGIAFGGPPDSSGVDSNAIFIHQCAPYNITFNNQFLDADSVKWYFGDGATSTDFVPTHEYLSTGIYYIHTDVWLNDTLSVWWQPYILDIGGNTPIINISQTNFCDSIVALFSGVSPGATSWLWTLGNGYTNTQPSFNYTFSVNNESYQVQLTTIDAEGCAGTATNSVYAPLIAPQFILDTLLCNSPLTITHNIDSTFTYLWDFGDGTTSTSPFPTHNYTNIGSYNVTLHLIDGIGCPHDYTVKTVGLYKPVAQFTANKHVGCAPLTVTFNSTSSGYTAGNSHYWFFTQNNYLNNNGQNPVNYTFTQPGVYPIKLTVFNIDGYNCSGEYYDTIYVHSPTASFTMTQNKTCIQPTMSVSFTDNTPNAAAWLWSFGDGTTSTQQNPVHLYSSMPTDTARLTVTTQQGCTASAVGVPLRFFNPVFNIGDDTLCLGTTGNYNIQSNNIMFSPSFNFGDGSPVVNYPTAQHTYAQSGNYTVNCYITASDGCKDTLTLPVWVVDPVASFYSNSPAACAPSNVVFHNTSQAPAGSTYRWDFGDGTSVTNNFPVVVKTYTTPGIYSVKLKITTPQGCVDSLVMSNYVTVLGPFADFVISQGYGCINDNLSFINLSTNVTNFKWVFGDGAKDSLNFNTIHAYDSVGSYTITLFTYDSLGCNSNKTLPIPFSVYNKPQAAMTISPTAGCAPFLPVYTNLSTGAVSYTWLFGNGDYSNDTIPTYTYPNAGLYTGSVIAVNQYGCTDTAYSDVKVFPAPSALFDIVVVDSSCERITVAFNNTSILDNDVAYKWGISNTGGYNYTGFEPPNFTFDSSATYVITMGAVNSVTGCADTVSHSMIINVPGFPIGSLTTTDTIACGQITANFNFTAQGASNTTLHYGDGASASNGNINPQHTYLQPGTYSPYLVMSNQFGCVDTVYGNTIKVIPNPVANFVSQQPKSCMAFAPDFINNSSNLYNPTYYWDMGNGQTFTDSLPTGVMYLYPQAYNVTLIVTNYNGCADTLTRAGYVVISDTVPPVTVPINRVTVLSEGEVKVEWRPSSAYDFGWYKVYRQTPSGFTLVATLNNVNETSFTDKGLSTLTNSYCYKIQAVDECNHAMPLDSLEAHCTMNVTATTEANQQRLVKWTPYGGCTVDYYEIYRTNTNAWVDTTTTFLIATVSSTQTSYVDSARICPREYKYRIKAVSLCATTLYSMSDTAKAPIPKVDYGTLQSDVSRSTVVENQFVRSEWKAPVFPELISYYTIYRSDDSLNYTSIGQINGPFSPIDTAFSYDDLDAPIQTQKCFYKIESTSQCDSKTGIGTTGDNMVLKVIVDPDSYSATIEWTPYVSWGPNGVNYYVIEYQDEAGNWNTLQLPGNQYPGNKVPGHGVPTSYSAPY